MGAKNFMRIHPLIVVLNLVFLLRERVNGYPVPMTLLANAAAKGAGTSSFYQFFFFFYNLCKYLLYFWVS